MIGIEEVLIGVAVLAALIWLASIALRPAATYKRPGTVGTRGNSDGWRQLIDWDKVYNNEQG